MKMDDFFIPKSNLKKIIQLFQNDNFKVIGPQEDQGAIVYDEIENEHSFPKGKKDLQSPGKYQLVDERSERYFQWSNGPSAIKPYLFAPRETLWTATPTDNGFVFKEPELDPQPLAFIGIKPCDLSALMIQDQHFLLGDYEDPYYKKRRENIFLVVVNCVEPSSQCFCHSTGDGPSVLKETHPYYSHCDWVMDELNDGFIIHAVSDKGSELLQRLTSVPATETQKQQANNQRQQSLESMQFRKAPHLSPETKDKMMGSLQNKQWDEVAEICLACGNCTAVCPTCFCHQEQDHAALLGDSTEHSREWDSCFNQAHSYIHGKQVKDSIKTRYQQWMTHKLSSWVDQYGRIGCVGCGRCTTWCPAGIDFSKHANDIVEAAQ